MSKYLVLVLLLSNLREFQGTVLRGSRAKNGQFPWLIQFNTILPCGGVLISPDWVLTAAQCVQYKRNSIFLYAAGLNGTNTSQTVSVKATYIYPEFQGYSEFRDYDNNIALLKLVRAFDMCDPKVNLLDIAPVRLQEEYNSCLIFGWESTVAPWSKVHAKPIQYSKVELNSWRVCKYGHRVNTTYRNIFCTVIDDGNGAKICAGNPGSPVVCKDQYQRQVLLGIASWTNFSLDCGGLPVYLSVSVFRTWMWDLIFGKRNMEQWEGVGEISGGACQNRRSLDRKKDNDIQILDSRNKTETDDERFLSAGRDDAKDYEFSWKSSNAKYHFSNGNKRSGVAKNSPTKSEEDPSVFDRMDDYAEITDQDSLKSVKYDDASRDGEDRSNQYREIGKDYNNRKKHLEDDRVAVASANAKISYMDRKSIETDNRRSAQEENTENFDVVELVLSDGIGDVNKSSCLFYFDKTNLKCVSFVATFTAFMNIFVL